MPASHFIKHESFITCIHRIRIAKPWIRNYDIKQVPLCKDAEKAKSEYHDLSVTRLDDFALLTTNFQYVKILVMITDSSFRNGSLSFSIPPSICIQIL